MQAATMKDLLLNVTRAQVEIRRRYASIKKDPQSRYFVYVLQLQSNKFYVGSTDNIFSRLLEHETRGPSASMWVKRHGPITRIAEIVQNAQTQDETTKTLEWMDLMGWDNVRGGPYCKTALAKAPAALASFVRGTHAYSYIPRTEIDSIHDTIKDLAHDLKGNDDDNDVDNDESDSSQASTTT